MLRRCDLGEETRLIDPRKRGELFGDLQRQRQVESFIVTEGYYPPSLRIRRHDHELASVCVVLAGSYDEEFGRQRRRAQPGMVIVHPEGEHHEETHDLVRVKLLTVEVATGWLEELRPSVRAFNESWHRMDYSITSLACRISSEIGRRDATSGPVIESSILEIFAALDSSTTAETNKSKWLSRVRERLESEFQHPPTLRQLAEMAGVHSVYLARAFRKRFGCSVGEYIRRLQVGKAAILLENESSPLSTVAYEAGFADQCHMTRRVRAETGLTPGALRRKGLARSND